MGRQPHRGSGLAPIPIVSVQISQRRGGEQGSCYVQTLQRLSSFTVTEWREDAYTVCKAITADTPVEYFDPVDLPIAPVTAGMMPYCVHSRRSRVDISQMFTHVTPCITGTPTQAVGQ